MTTEASTRVNAAPPTNHAPPPQLRPPGDRTWPERSTCRSRVCAPTRPVEPDARPAARAANTSSASWNRSSGFFAKHFTIAAESHWGIFALTSLATGTGSARCFPTISALELPS